MAWLGEWAKALKARDKLLLGEAGWKGLLQAGKGNVGPERHSWCTLAMALLCPPLPCPLVSVPVVIELLDTRLCHSPGASAWTNRAQRAPAAGGAAVSSPDPQAWGVPG